MGVGLSGLISNLPGTLTPYPTQDPALELGGFRSVANAAARDAIPANFRTVGMQVVLQDTGIVYQLVGGTANANWRTGAGASSPLRGQYFVDATFTGLSTGSSSNPFTSFAQAFTAAQVAGVTSGVIYATSSVTENVVFPATGNWEIRGILTSYYTAGVIINGTVNVGGTSTATDRYIGLVDVQITGLISGDNSNNGATLLRLRNCSIEGGVSLTGNRTAPWSAYFEGISSTGNGFGGYSENAPINVKGLIYGLNWVFYSPITCTCGNGASPRIDLVNCLANNISLTLDGPTAGGISVLVAKDSGLNSTTITFTGPATPVFALDAITCASIGQHGSTVVGTNIQMSGNGYGTQKAVNQVANKAPAQIWAKHPSPMLRMTAALTLVTPGTAGNAVVNAVYTDSLGVARTKPVTPPLNIAGAAGDEASGELVFSQNGAAITAWSVTGITTPGPLNYTVNVNISSAA